MGNDPFDPYGPLTGAGQTAWGSLIRSQNEVFERQQKAVDESAAMVRRLRGEGSPSASYPLEPRRSLPPEQQKRCKTIRQRITAKPGLLDRLAGRVITYLDDQGDLLADAQGDLAPGKIVKWQEHLRRLTLAYRRYYEFGLKEYESKKSTDEAAKLACIDAKERLDLLKRGLFLSPLSKNGSVVTARVRSKKTWFGKKQVSTDFSTVRIAGYDKHFRQFVCKVYDSTALGLSTGRSGKPTHQIPVKTIFENFRRFPGQGKTIWRLPAAIQPSTPSGEAGAPPA